MSENEALDLMSRLDSALKIGEKPRNKSSDSDEKKTGAESNSQFENKTNFS